MAEEPARAIGYSFSVTLDDKRQIVAQTHVDQEWGQEAIDEVLDKIAKSVQRQKDMFYLADLKRWLPVKKRKLEEQNKLFGLIEDRHKADWATRGKKGEFRLDPKEEGERKTALSGIDRYMEEIAIDEAEIAKLEKDLGP